MCENQTVRGEYMLRLRVSNSDSQDMKCSTIILLLNAVCAFSKTPHEIIYVVGCFDNGTIQVQFEIDADELLYVDFERHEVVYTVPRFLVEDPSGLFENLHVYKNALKAKRACSIAMPFLKAEEKFLPEAKDPPESTLYPAEEAQLGVENSLTCFVNHFYPPDINISWTKNGQPVTEGVSLSRYYPNNDRTFHQFSTLTFTPWEGDIYSCSVEHSALDRPTTKIWESKLSHSTLGADIYCGVGLALGLLGVAAGTFLMVKGHEGRNNFAV